jgi:aryl-alcohol dehydrogenase-like predicted oxidoreductase
MLEAAVGLGLTHIDTAPAYGDTLAEREIGRALKARRSDIVIVTKYGVPVDPMIAALAPLAFPLRAGRAVLRKAGLQPRPRPPMTAAGLRASVEASLRRLNTDYVDALLLHEPEPVLIPDPEGIVAELMRLQAAGLVRSYGLAGVWRGIAALGDVRHALGVIVQTGERDWPPGSPPDITYSALTDGPQSFSRRAIDQEAARARLSAALGRRPNGVVLVSASDPARLAALVQVAAV